jgi:hypothetical protein
MTPEEEAREIVDESLAGAGWKVQDYRNLNLAAALGVAVREFSLKTATDDLAVTRDTGAHNPAYKKLAKTDYRDANHRPSLAIAKAGPSQAEVRNDNTANALSDVKLAADSNLQSPLDTSPRKQWAGLDSNQRRLTPTGLQPVPFSHSGTDPAVL